MKKIINILLFALLALSVQAQNVPDIIRTSPIPATGANKNNRATVDANLKAALALNIPRFATNTLNGAKDSIGYIGFNTTTNRFVVYRGGGTWDQYLTSGDVTTIGDGRYGQLVGGNLWNGPQYVTGQVGATTFATSSYGGTLIPGDASFGNVKVSAINNGPFLGTTTYRNSLPTFRSGEAAGGGSFVIQKYQDGNWINVFKTDSATVTASNGLTQVGSDIQLGGDLTHDVTVNAQSNLFTVSGSNLKGGFAIQGRSNIGRFGPNDSRIINVVNDTLGNNAGTEITALNSSIYRVTDFGKTKSINSTGEIIDGIDNKGLYYQLNYRGNFTEYSLIDKGYADSAYTAYVTNLGLVKTGDYTTLTNFTNNDDAELTFAVANQLTNKNGVVDLTQDGVFLSTGNNGLSSQIKILKSTGLVIDDALFNRGIKYNNDYSANFTLRSLVDKQYVDNKVGGAGYLPLTGGTMTGDLILTSATPTNALSAAPKAYIDNLITGITWKNSVRVKTTANITLTGTQTIDGVALAVGNRVLVNNQTTGSQNGIYSVATGAWTRVPDADESSELETATVAVTAGTTNKNTQWTYVGTSSPVVGTDAILFGQISGAGTYTNGTYLTLNGNVFDANLTAFDARYVSLSGSYANPSWIASLAYSKITGAPTAISSFTNDAGYLTNTTGDANYGRLTAANTWSGANVFSSTTTLNDRLIVSRNVNDANPVSSFTQANASATGDITIWNSSSGLVAKMTSAGTFVVAGISNLTAGANGRMFFGSTGVSVTRDVGDANPSFLINNINTGGTSTGNLLTLQASSNTKFAVNISGQVFGDRFSSNTTTAGGFPAVFYLGTNNFSTSGNFSNVGQGIRQDAITYTYTGTAATVSNHFVNAYQVATLGSTNAETITNAYGNFAYPPIAGTNMTITRSYAYGFGGHIDLRGDLYQTVAPSAYSTGGNSSIVRNTTTGRYETVTTIQPLRLTGSGTGSATTISIAHGLTGVTSASIVSVTPLNAASTGTFYITKDATNINIVYSVAPAAGTGNLSYDAFIKP